MDQFVVEPNVVRRHQYVATKDDENAHRRARYHRQKQTYGVHTWPVGASASTPLTEVGRTGPILSHQLCNIYNRLLLVPTEPWTLSPMPVCLSCQAMSFFGEPPTFCCSNGRCS